MKILKPVLDTPAKQLKEFILTDIRSSKFILDENVDQNLVKIFKEINIVCTTIDQQNKKGITNGELAYFVSDEDYVLVTHDQDFEVLWKVLSIKVILLKIHPTTVQNIKQNVLSFLETYKRPLSDQFLIVLTGSGILTFEDF